MSFVNPYNYSSVEKYVVAPAASSGQYHRLALSFPSAGGLITPGLKDASGTCYLPRPTRRSPLVVLAHGVGDSSTIPCHLLARALADAGIASLVVYLPIHSSRIPADLKERFSRLSAQEWFDLYRVSVINMRQALDWAASLPEIDPDRMGVAGISFGGYVAAITLGVDERLKAGAILLACGNQGKLAWTRSSRRFARWNISEEAFRQHQENYLSYVAEVSAQGFKNVEPPYPGYPFDPYTFCSTISDKQTLLVNARWDEYFPRQAAEDFRQACGNPKQVWLPAGHASAWLFYPIIRHHVVGLFRDSFQVKSGE